MNSIEPLEDLIARVETMLPEIDLDRDLSKDVACTIAVAEMSGTPLTETQKKLVVLMSLGRITSDEHMRIALDGQFELRSKRSKTKSALRLAGSIKTDKRNVPIEDLSMPSPQRDIGEELIAGANDIKAHREGKIRPKIRWSELIAARHNLELSQSEFADLLGISKQKLEQLEQEHIEPSETLRRLIQIAIRRPDVLIELFRVDSLSR